MYATRTKLCTNSPCSVTVDIKAPRDNTRPSHRTSRMPPLCICINARETGSPVITTAASPCSPSQAKFSQEPFSTDLLPTSNKASYLKASVASEKNVVPLTWCLLQDSSRRNVKSRTLTYTPPMLISPKHLTLSVERACGE